MPLIFPITTMKKTRDAEFDEFQVKLLKAPARGKETASGAPEEVLRSNV